MKKIILATIILCVVLVFQFVYASEKPSCKIDGGKLRIEYKGKMYLETVELDSSLISCEYHPVSNYEFFIVRYKMRNVGTHTIENFHIWALYLPPDDDTNYLDLTFWVEIRLLHSYSSTSLNPSVSGLYGLYL